ncbi:MAG: gamma-glutamyl-gamma-aminobutyrate hydrolase family protein, partial [Erysipelotrichaceae bacterium]|nr:gamma-glutamyl-gamma-aminobutyrate hydrolase family protein [Erysipelotrichaceae bacterium]
MILLIHNYDSISYNLYQLVGTVNPDIKVVRNDKITVDEVKAMNPEAIILSPGPGKPSDAGNMEDIIEAFYKVKPILGICLGHQAICEVFGARITYAKKLMHGKVSEIELTDDPLFKGIDKRISVARYHSLVAVDLPECLEVIAQTDDHEVMAVKHKDYPVYGLQFHPESVLTKDGLRIMKNFLGGEKMIKEAIQLLVKNQDLTREQAYQCMDEIMSG